MKKEKSIFELFLIEYRDEKPKYPSFEVDRRRIGIFSSLVKAERGINKYIKEQKHYEKLHNDNRLQGIFGFLIKEFSFDEPSWFHPKNQRNYLSDGSFWDENPVSEMVNKDGDLEEFLGRPADKIRFQIGDLVEVFGYDTVTLDIVGMLPPTPEEVQQLHENNRKRYEERHENYNFKLDSSDDCYYTLDHYGDHGHPYAVHLFPPRFPVSDKLRKKLEKVVNEVHK